MARAIFKQPYCYNIEKTRFEIMLRKMKQQFIKIYWKMIINLRDFAEIINTPRMFAKKTVMNLYEKEFFLRSNISNFLKK